VQSIATLMLHASRPQMLARELVQIFEATECVKRAIATSQVPGNAPELIAATRDAFVDPDLSTSGMRRLTISNSRDCSYEIAVDPKPDIESLATLNAITLLLSAIHDLERARIEREERATLWPIDDLPLEHGSAVVTGHMRELMDLALRIAPTDVPVLITGESGTGKEILARAIHSFSTRASKPLIPFNCAAIPREMLESQLFGHRRGAFTGADRDQPGVIRTARDGTLFLDEIGEMSLDLQPKILRFLESGEIAPLGEPSPLNVNVRIIAATNADLETTVRNGRFREDLFYRIAVFPLKIKPLRERRDEIPSLVNAFVTNAAVEFQKGHVRVAEETMEHLLLCRWPGNVRQLLNEVRRMVALAEPNSTLSPANISDDIRATLPAFPAPTSDSRQLVLSLRGPLAPARDRLEREMILSALRDAGGRLDVAAKALGISRKGLYLKRLRLGI
jgi:DNA-binding NtrC family response regulator